MVCSSCSTTPAGNAAGYVPVRDVCASRSRSRDGDRPLLAGVGWSWLIDALEGHGAHYDAPSGTVTSVSSESFGGPVSHCAEIKVRASWTPLLEEELGSTSSRLRGLNYSVR